MSSDPLFDGKPISLLKVVELRKILDDFQLSKSGVKKELFERLRDYLNSQSDGGEEAPVQEAETTSRPSTRSSASPRKTVSPTKSPTKAASPVKSPPPTNKYVAQYLQNQQATLEEIKRTELLKAASDAESIPEVASVGPVIDVLPAAEKDEVSSTVSNAGSDPQAIPDDTSIINESKSEDISMEQTIQFVDEQLVEQTIQSVDEQLVEEAPSKSEPEVLSKEESKAVSEKDESSSENESRSSCSEKAKSKSPEKTTQEKIESPTKVVSADDEESIAVSPKKEVESETKEVKESKDESAIELDYDEEESTEPVKKEISAIEEDSEKEKSETPVTVKKHRAIVFDLDNKPSEKSDSAPTSSSRKTTISVRPTVTAKPPEKPSEYGTNSVGNVRVRPVSPARKEPTEFIHITHLKRPYVVAHLQAVLQTFGEFSDDDFWIDQLRSNCIVKYKSVESAQKAREEMHNIKWPDVPEAPMLNVEFTTDEKFQRQRADPSNRKSSFGAEKSGLIIHVSNDRKLSTEEKDDISEKSAESRKRKTPPPKNTKTLEELFKKTKAKPQIYYLPLTDEEIVAKKQRRKH